MTKSLQNASLKSEEIVLHSMEDKDFDQWLATIEVADTESLFLAYRKYAAEAVAKDEEIMLFHKWRERERHTR